MDTWYQYTRWVAVVLGVADTVTHWVLGCRGISGSRRGGGGGAERHRVTATVAPREFFILFNPRTQWVHLTTGTINPLVKADKGIMCTGQVTSTLSQQVVLVSQHYGTHLPRHNCHSRPTIEQPLS